ncbi:hypothetical protein SUGI_0362470 [Cryptomeria japonica]|nr:hypothetical protein SUGI_0362470 [Cryptomeria japonica]
MLCSCYFFLNTLEFQPLEAALTRRGCFRCNFITTAAKASLSLSASIKAYNGLCKNKKKFERNLIEIFEFPSKVSTIGVKCVGTVARTTLLNDPESRHNAIFKLHPLTVPKSEGKFRDYAEEDC